MPYFHTNQMVITTKTKYLQTKNKKCCCPIVEIISCMSLENYVAKMIAIAIENACIVANEMNTQINVRSQYLLCANKR